MKQKTIQQRLFVQVRDNDREPKVNELGQELIPIKWIEVEDIISLGSFKKPNKEILAIKIDTRV
jgi:hypothetical protein